MKIVGESLLGNRADNPMLIERLGLGPFNEVEQRHPLGLRR